MKSIDLYLFLTSFTLSIAVAVVAEFLRRRDARFLITVVVSLLGVSATAFVGFYLKEDTSYWGKLHFLVAERDFSSVVAIVMGVAAAWVWTTRSGTAQGNGEGWFRRWIEPILLATSIAVVVLCGQAFLWKDILGFIRHSVRVDSRDFVIEEIAVLDNQPLRIASDEDGKIFLCYDYFKKHGAIGGVILQLSQDPASPRTFQKRTVAESPFLVRPYGLAVRDGDLFVSRSGFFPRTSMGKVTYENTGAVTQLTDVDGDGYFEYAHDVVSDLPGVRGTDTMQQNNGIAFGVGLTDEDLVRESVVDPRKVIAPAFQSVNVLLDNGLAVTGNLISRTDDRLTVLTRDDQNQLQRQEILLADVEYEDGEPLILQSQESLMPTGFEQLLTPEELEAVLTLIRQLN